MTRQEFNIFSESVRGKLLAIAGRYFGGAGVPMGSGQGAVSGRSGQGAVFGRTGTTGTAGTTRTAGMTRTAGTTRSAGMARTAGMTRTAGTTRSAGMARTAGMTRTAEMAEDIVQEALVTVWKLSEEGYPIRDAEGLAVKITKNLTVASYRKQKFKVLSLSGGWSRGGSGSGSGSGDDGGAREIELEGGEPATALTDARDRAMIREKLYGALTETQRKYLELRNELGLSLDEIAEATGRPKASIKTSISTARKQLLEQLKKEL